MMTKIMKMKIKYKQPEETNHRDLWERKKKEKKEENYRNEYGR